MTEERILAALDAENLNPSEQSLAEFCQINEPKKLSADALA